MYNPNMPHQNDTQVVSMSACREYDPVFFTLIESVADRLSLSSRQLAVRTLMQIPRIADVDGNIDMIALRAEIEYVAEILAHDLAAYRSEAVWPETVGSVSDLVFDRLDQPTARSIFGRLHYLKSYREDSEAYALFTPDTHQPLAACTVSPLQWDALAELIESTTGVQQDQVFDISRVFAFDIAPKNSISMLLGAVRKAVRQTHPEAKLLSTVVDQNLGFTGQSYMGANWRRWCRIQPRSYYYVDREYQTIRQLRVLYGEQQWEEFAQDDSRNIQTSKLPLLDSIAFIQPLAHGAPEALQNQDYYLERQD